MGLNGFFSTIIALLIMQCSFPFGASANENISEREQTLVIGRVSQNPKKHYRELKLIVDYAVGKMADMGFTKGDVLMAPNKRKLADYLKNGQVDWVSDSPFAAIFFEQHAGAEILLRRWKKGVAEYHCVFFARTDSGINTLSDLKGKTVAFEDPGSTSSFFIPVSILLQHNIKPVHLATNKDKPGPDEVGYKFSYQEINSATWVHKKIVDAAAFSNLDWQNDQRTLQNYKKEFKIFHTTKSFPRAFEVVRTDLDSKIKDRLKKVLLNAHIDPAAKKVLKKYNRTNKFDVLNKSTLERMQELRQLFHHLNSSGML